MLEDDIREVYRQMNDRNMPPSRISIPAAGRAARARLRRRRAGTIGAPVFAAVSVLAIALATTGLTGTGANQAAAPSRTPAPRHFSNVRPYAWFAKPRNGQMRVPVPDITTVYDALGYAAPHSPRGILIVWADGTCHRRSGTLSCQNVGISTAFSGPLGQYAGTVDGSPAYWQNDICPDPAGSICPSQGLLGYSYDKLNGALRWQYASGGWAALAAQNLRDALQLSREVRFGPKAAPPTRFPFQLTGMSARWQVAFVSGYWPRGGVLGPSEAYIADRPGALDSSSALQFSLTKGTQSCPAAKHNLDGSTVMVCSATGWQHLMAIIGRGSNAVTLNIWVGHDPEIGLVDLLEHHLRLFGANRRDWTTQPVR